MKKLRRVVAVIMMLALAGATLVFNGENYEARTPAVGGGESVGSRGSEEGSGGETGGRADESRTGDGAELASRGLTRLVVKGRAPKTGYAREQFYRAWPIVEGCSLRQRIIRREIGDGAEMRGCDVVGGNFIEPYLGEKRVFESKAEISKGIQIDHVVALSDAWQKGAQSLSKKERYALATDPLNLLAVDGPANMEKGDGDAATWLPKNKAFRCQYVARQISVKLKYGLWVTAAEQGAMGKVLERCPEQRLIGKR